MRYFLLLGLFLGFAAQPVAAKECTKFEAYTAESLYPYLSSWKEMHMAFRAYGHCDDGAIAEGFDEAISVLWERHWKLVPEMLNETATDPEFKQFVFKRVGRETIPMKRWQVIVNNAKTGCPSNAKTFCQQVLASGEGK